ncbi:hypothetical protein STEG23_023560 [Scotinomys teguina]
MEGVTRQRKRMQDVGVTGNAGTKGVNHNAVVARFQSPKKTTEDQECPERNHNVYSDSAQYRSQSSVALNSEMQTDLCLPSVKIKDMFIGIHNIPGTGSSQADRELSFIMGHSVHQGRIQPMKTATALGSCCETPLDYYCSTQSWAQDGPWTPPLNWCEGDDINGPFPATLDTIISQNPRRSRLGVGVNGSHPRDGRLGSRYLYKEDAREPLGVTWQPELQDQLWAESCWTRRGQGSQGPDDGVMGHSGPNFRGQ